MIWRKLSEMKPSEKGKPYLVFVPAINSVSISFWKGRCFADFGNEVTHWMNLPEPPEDK
jgi:hypothetical protein